MSPFIFRCSLFVSIQLVIGCILICKGLEPADEANGYLAAILDKQQALRDYVKPRLILVGGSNVAFGFNSQQLGEDLQLKPANFGLHAGLGLFFPLNIVEQHVRSGDVVVISFEYSVIAASYIDGDPVVIKEASRILPAGQQFANVEFDWKRFMDREALDLVHHWVKRGQRRLGGGERRQISTIYQRNNFNQFGDMIGHHGQPSSGSTLRDEVEMVGDALDRAVERLNHFYKICSQKGAQVYYSFPPVPQELYARSRETIEMIDENLRARLSMPIIDSPSEMVFPPSEFFDSDYHLTRTGAATRTERVASAILNRQNRQAGSNPRFR